MNKVWLQIFATMIGGSIFKSIFPHPLIWVGIDLAILGICYLILRRNLTVNLKASMLLLTGLTVISILTDLNLMSDVVSSILVLGLIGWVFFKRSGSGNGNGSGSSKGPTIRHKWHK